jgi:steroid delta-isomerase-like uncharacterized protein
MNRSSRLVGIALVILSLLTLSGLPMGAQDATPATDCPAASPEEVKTLLGRYWSEIWTAGGDAATGDVLAADEVHHWGIGGDTTGVDAFNERLRLFLTAFPDISFSADLVVVEGNLGATLWTATGTQRGEWQGIAPTDREVTWTGINIFRIECGLIAESWGEADHIGLRRQLGATDIPAMASPAATSTSSGTVAAATPCPNDSTESNAAIVEEWIEGVWTSQDVAVLEEIFDRNGIHQSAVFGGVRGPEGFRAAVEPMVRAFPDLAFTVDMSVADGERVVVRWSGPATHAARFLGVEPSNTTVDFTGISVYQLNCGRIIESLTIYNTLDVFRQMIGESSS